MHGTTVTLNNVDILSAHAVAKADKEVFIGELDDFPWAEGDAQFIRDSLREGRIPRSAEQLNITEA